MSSIRIKHFGPIKEGYQAKDGWLDIQKVTVFIGNQGSGKSTIAKLISTFTWIEKALVRGDYDSAWFEQAGKFKSQYLAYHNLSNYLTAQTDIEYKGNAYTIRYTNGQLSIKTNNNTNIYLLPQVMYIPAERNLVAHFKSPKTLKLTSDALTEFVTAFEKAKEAINATLALPINKVEIEYDKSNDTVNIQGLDYKVLLNEASSGFQSIVPLYMVTWDLANSVKNQSQHKDQMSSEELQRFRKGVADIWANTTLSDEQRSAALSVLSSRFNKAALVNIIEEPEQNLFPAAQFKMLMSLLHFNNMNEGNTLIMTTHSPYIINYLSIAIQAKLLKNKIEAQDKGELLAHLEEIIPIASTIAANDIAIYQVDDEGNINSLPTYEGLPSDQNYLNLGLAEGNTLFDKLLEIEEALYHEQQLF